MKDNKESASNILLNKNVANITYGGKKYTITRLKLKQMLKIISIVSSQYNCIQEAIITETKKIEKELSSNKVIMIILENLSEDQLIEFIAVILNEDRKIVLDNFSFADMLEVVTTTAKLEDIEKIFFQIAQAINMIPKTKEDQSKETA